MSGPLLVLASAAEIRAIARRALDALYALGEEEYEIDDDVAARHQTERREGALEALRFCAQAAGLLREPSLLPEIAEAIDAFVWDDEPSGFVATCAAGVEMLVRAGAPIDATVRALAQHPDETVREFVATGLPADRPDAVALLEGLAADPVASVRGAARKALAKVRELAWWVGKFESDPLARVPPERAAELAPVFARIGEILDVDAYRRPQHDEEFIELAGRLPEALAVEVLERAIAGGNDFKLHDSPLFGALLVREGGAAALMRLVERWCAAESEYYPAEGAKAAIEALPTDVRARLAPVLLDAVTKRPAGERGALTHSVATELAELAAAAWPTDLDPTPALDAMLAMGADHEARHDYVVGKLDEILAHSECTADGPLARRVIEARLADYAGAWKPLFHAADTFLARVAPSALRPAVEEALRDAPPVDAVLKRHEIYYGKTQWALGLLLTGRAYDPARDPPRPELALRMFAEPRYRHVMLELRDLLKTVLAPLRKSLRAGELERGLAVRTLEVVIELWGEAPTGEGTPGRWGRARASRDEGDEGDEARRAEQKRLRDERARWKVFLGPRSLHGPPTDAEWKRFRAARDAGPLVTEEDWCEAVRLFPAGPLKGPDREIFERALAAAREHRDELPILLAATVARHGEAADLPLFDVLEPLVPKRGIPLTRMYRRDRYAELGVEDPRPPGRTDDADDDDATGAADDADWPDDADDDDATD